MTKKSIVFFLLIYLFIISGVLFRVIPENGFEFLEHPKFASWFLVILVCIFPLGCWLLITLFKTHASYNSSQESFSLMLASHQQAKKLNSEKSIFLATVSHEIRNPLQAILGTHELLLNDHYLKKDSKKLIQNAHQTTKSLLEILNQVLDLSKIEAGKISIQYESTDLKKLIHKSIQSFQALIDTNHVKLKMYLDPTIAPSLLIDSIKLNQVLSNLIGNSIKFTSEGSIIVSAHVVNDTHADQSIQIQVIDTGCGIPLVDLERMIEPYERASSKTVQLTPGSGLGLSIVNQLLISMGSNLKIESTPQMGTSISFRLNFKRSSNAPSHDRFLSPIESKIASFDLFKGKKVLIVDDYPACQEIVDQQCKHLGFVCYLAVDAQSAIEMIKKEQIDVLITDEFMPDMSGSNLSFIVREYQPDIKIIVLTGDQLFGEKYTCYEKSIHAYLIKPVSLSELSKTLYQVFSPPNLWSFDELLNYTNHHLNDANEILRSILVTQEEIEQELSDALDNQNWGQVRHLSHKVLSGARLIKAEQLITCCHKIQSVETADAKNQVEILLKNLSRVNNQLREFLNKDEQSIG
jgi:two-component system sensor histidine kinase EvgS